MNLPTLDQALSELHALEKRYDEGTRVEQTRRALERNHAIASDEQVVQGFYKGLAKSDMFVPIYGAGEIPWSLPLHMPPYLIQVLLASAKVLFALVRENLKREGPQYLMNRCPKGWLTEEMAQILHNYYLTVEPDMAFDVLVYGANSERGVTFDEFRASGDHLYAKILEAQSVDTYYGWLRECMKAARATGAYKDSIFTTVRKAERYLTDGELDEQVMSTYVQGLEDKRGRILFLEIDPRNQPSFQNLHLLARFMSQGNESQEAPILDPQDVYFDDGGQLNYKWSGKEGPINKVISRLVDVDLQSYIKKMTAAGKAEVIERLRKMFAEPSLWPDLSKHLAGFYLVDKSSITELSMLGQVGVAPKTWIIQESDLESFRKDPSLLKELAVKPLHGMSAKGVYVSPELDVVEKACAEETMLAQELFWATPLMPNINKELTDPDAQAGICSETRLVLHAGSPAVSDNPNRARCILALTRSHYASKDSARKIKGDSQGRGWFSNMGAILAVKAELGLVHKRDAGLGMSPVCWLD